MNDTVEKALRLLSSNSEELIAMGTEILQKIL